MHRKGMGMAVAICLLLLASCGALAEVAGKAPTPAASLADSPYITMEAELGYGGAVTYMREIPFTVTVRNDGPDITGTIGVNLFRNERQYDRYELPVTLASGAAKRVELPVKLKMKQDSYHIELIAGGAVVEALEKKPDRTINPEAVLIGVLSPQPQSVAYMNTTVSSAATDRNESWQLVSLNAQRFPQLLSLMDSFMILVVDGFDMSTLSTVQQQVFDQWLSGGGIVVVGGGAQAATDYPYFTKYTGLAAGGILEGEEITQALARYAVIDREPLGKPVLLNAAAGDAQPLVSGNHPLIYKHSAGAGLIYTAAFELGAKPLTDWPGIGSLWPRVILKSAPDIYAIQYSALSRGIWGGASSSSYLLNSVPIENSGSTIPAIALLTGYVLLAGAGSYLLLRKLDKREWMWLTVPLLSLVCLAGLYGLSRVLPYSKPMAVTLASIQVNDKGEAVTMRSAAIAGPDAGEAIIRAGDGGMLTPVDEESYYVDLPSTVKAAPSELKYRFLLGDDPAVGFPEGPSWMVNKVEMPTTRDFDGQVEARLWFEEDGIHARITNNTPYTLEQGLMITSMGYAAVGDLLPGESAEPFLLRDILAEKNAGAPIQIYDTKIQDGKMISPYLTQNGGWELYPIIRAAIYPEEQAAAGGGQAPVAFSAAQMQERFFKENTISQLINTDWSGKGNGIASPFHFTAFAGEIGRTQISINGEPVTRVAHRAVVDVIMTFEPVGRTGIVFYPPGMLPVYAAEDFTGGKPLAQMGEPLGRNSYIQLSQKPTFCFMLPDTAGMEISALTIMPASYDSTPTLRLFNHQTGVWDDQKSLFLPLSQAKAQPYIGPEGELFVQFVPSETSRDFDGMMAPSIMLEGRQK